ncbi:MAG: multicopper oxidase family protein [Propionicimonas sp.]
MTDVRHRTLRWMLPLGLSLVVIVPLAVLWQRSLVPGSASVMTMGEPEFGTGVAFGGHGHMAGGTETSVTDLVDDSNRRPDVTADLRADAAMVAVGGRQVKGFTVNGTSPGPTIRARQGQLVEVRFTNGSVPGGATLHWHGMDVPNAMDGVAGVTQDAVAVGQSFTYRFSANRAGTYWYHSHQISHSQVIGGLLGAIIVDPAERPASAAVEVVALAHTYGGVRTINGLAADLRARAQPGDQVRIRVINTDNATLPVWSAQPLTLAAIDGADVNDPAAVSAVMVGVAAGGRADVVVQVPARGAARVQLSKTTAVIVGPDAADASLPAQPSAWLDLLSYGKPTDTGLDPSHVDRSFSYRMTQQPGFVMGRPGVWWAINDQLYPHEPMFMVRRGELVAVHFDNATTQTHPMHLHGHHLLVVARNSVPASGSPWWTDSLDVLPGETYDVVFQANNPGIWMDHCHNLDHAKDGMVTHLAYEGVTTPFLLGGDHHNEPE